MMCTAEIYPSYHSSPIVASDDEEHPIGSKFHDYGSHFNSSAILHGERKWRSCSEEDYPFCADFSPVSRFSVVVRREKFSPTAFPPKPVTPARTELRVDFVCELPVEVATIILGFLQPEDLCRYEKVARRRKKKEHAALRNSFRGV